MNSYIERVVILLFSFLALPLLIVLSVLSFFKMGLPIFFKQERAGLNGIPFYIYKFRSMTNEKDSVGNLLPNHQRLTNFGHFLRKTSLDEIPQIINLLKGDITLVGPRPLHVEYNELYNRHQRKRLTVKPGITGLAQVSGRNNLTWEEKFDLDVYYVENKSFILDVKILIKTILKVLKKSDIDPDGQTQTPRFKG